MKFVHLFWKPAGSRDEIRNADACERRDGRSWVGFDVSALVTLAHNLAQAGFGAAMFRAGDNFGFHMGSDETQCTCQWRPGSGEPYRGSTWCEQDDIYDEPDEGPDDMDELDYMPEPSCAGCGFTAEGCIQAVGCDFGEPEPTPGPNGCTCGFNGDCNCRFVP